MNIPKERTFSFLLTAFIPLAMFTIKSYGKPISSEMFTVRSYGKPIFVAMFTVKCYGKPIFSDAFTVTFYGKHHAAFWMLFSAIIIVFILWFVEIIIMNSKPISSQTFPFHKLHTKHRLLYNCCEFPRQALSHSRS